MHYANLHHNNGIKLTEPGNLQLVQEKNGCGFAPLPGYKKESNQLQMQKKLKCNMA